MFLSKMGTGGHASGGVAGAIDFDGTNDYLSRSSDLVGNVDGKTFTFSAWVWVDTTNSQYIYSSRGVEVRVDLSNNLIIQAQNASGVSILNLASTIPRTVIKTFVNIIVSIDLSSTTNRHVVINDTPCTSITWATYTNDTIDFTNISHYVSAKFDAASKLKGRLSHLYLDYTYRDLSVEANRRLFITADRKPTPKATLAALNPILYLPLDDPTQPGLNLGTGGDFALNGVVARSGRGPNQFNAPYSDLDGAADYLSRTSITGVADGKTFTISFAFRKSAIDDDCVFNCLTASLYNSFRAYTDSANNRLIVTAQNVAGTTILNASTSTNSLVANRNYIVQISCDLLDANKRHIYINGQAATVTWATYTDDTIDFTVPNYYIGQVFTNNGLWLGQLGNVFFDTRYIDLSDPANLAKFVTGTGIDAKPVDLGANGELPFGTPPLIYLPMYGNNAGKNYGTGGDFTVNSGPYPGSRGPNEFWGNKAYFDGSTGYLARTSALSGVSDGNKFSAVFTVTFDVSTTLMTIINCNSNQFHIYRTDGNSFSITLRTLDNSILLAATTVSTSFTTGTFNVMVCVDLSNSANRYVYVNNVSQSVTWSSYVNGSAGFTDIPVGIGARGLDSAMKLNGKLSELYFTTDYIDFSQETNRLKFRDAFGNPVDLTPQIEAGEIPTPAIYMRFDPANFGKNSGTGGDFTVRGTITDGGQL